MLQRNKWHKSINSYIIEKACERRMNSLDNPGFCLTCGNESNSCEPDARKYECEACGALEVYGSEELLWYVM